MMTIVNRYLLNIPSELGDVTLTTLLTQDGMGMYACYQGVGSMNWILHHGRKLTFSESRSFFSVPKNLYRK